MKVIINGNDENIKDTISIKELLLEKDVNMPDMVSVELNGDILSRDDYSKVLIKENDKIEFLYFMGGGLFNGK